MARRTQQKNVAPRQRPDPLDSGQLRVFLSWSGDRSQFVAKALKGVIEGFFDDVEGWLSALDIDAGQRWATVLGEVLASTYFGVLCLTPENLESRWVLFEAGALYKHLSVARVIPYCIGVKKTGVGPPLSQFQIVEADREGTYKLMASINGARTIPLSKDKFQSRFDAYWPALENLLKSAPTPEGPTPEGRKIQDILDEGVEVLSPGPMRILRGLFDEKDGREMANYKKYYSQDLRTLIDRGYVKKSGDRYFLTEEGEGFTGKYLLSILAKKQK